MATLCAMTTGTMLISVLSGAARVRRITVSLPLVAALLEAPTRFCLPGKVEPMAPADPPAVVKHRSG